MNTSTFGWLLVLIALATLSESITHSALLFWVMLPVVAIFKYILKN